MAPSLTLNHLSMEGPISFSLLPSLSPPPLSPSLSSLSLLLSLSVFIYSYISPSCLSLYLLFRRTLSIIPSLFLDLLLFPSLISFHSYPSSFSFSSIFISHLSLPLSISTSFPSCTPTHIPSPLPCHPPSLILPVSLSFPLFRRSQV